jgi:DNA-binding NarL/FixJ family response regulator
VLLTVAIEDADPGGAAARRAGSPHPRERQVVAGIATSESNKETATHLGLSEITAKHYVSNIFDNLDVSSRAELAVYATSRGGRSRRLLAVATPKP